MKFIFCLLNFFDSSWFLFKQTQAIMKIRLGFGVVPVVYLLKTHSVIVFVKKKNCCCNRPTTLSLASFRNL